MALPPTDDVAPVYLTQATLLEVPERVLPPNYIDPIKAALRGGWELLRSYAKMWERVSIAVGRFETASYISTAHGPSKAQTKVLFQRPTAFAGAVTVKTGTLLKASSSGAVFRTLEDAFFNVLALGPIEVLVEAIGYGHEFNAAGSFTTPAGEEVLGEIDQIILPLLDPPFGDQSISVIQRTEATGGNEGALDMWGAERDIQRTPGESDPSYQQRIREVPDVVTPAAMRRQVHRFMTSLGYTDADWYMVETWSHRYQECYDAVDSIFTFEPDYDLNLCAFDDPRPASPIRNRWYTDATREGAFVLEIPGFPAVDDHGLAYDETPLTEADLDTKLGRLATPAYDIPDTGTAATISGCAYDGVDLALDALHLRLWHLLENTKASGIVAIVHGQGD